MGLASRSVAVNSSRIALGALTALGTGWVIAHRRAATWSPPVGTIRRLTLSARVSGHGAPVVLLHGLLGSAQYWGAEFDRLGSDHMLVVPDLLGFGSSPHPEGGYTLAAHALAVIGLLDDLAIDQPVVIVAHSLGTLIALRIAQLAPDRVTGIVAFGPPLYADNETARQSVGRLGGFVRLLAFDTPLAERVCAWMCSHRRLAARIAMVARPDLPAPIAADTVSHTWSSYSNTVTEVLLSGNGADRFAGVDTNVVLIRGDRDRVVDPAYLDELADSLANVTNECWRGGHDLPLRMPRRCANRIRTFVDSARPPQHLV